MKAFRCRGEVLLRDRLEGLVISMDCDVGFTQKPLVEFVEGFDDGQALFQSALSAVQ